MMKETRRLKVSFLVIILFEQQTLNKRMYRYANELKLIQVQVQNIRFQLSPEKTPLERSMRSFRAKKSLLSRRYLRDPRPLLMDLRNGQRTYGNTVLILFRIFATCCNVGTLVNRKGLTALTHSIGCKRTNKIRITNAKLRYFNLCQITALQFLLPKYDQVLGDFLTSIAIFKTHFQFCISINQIFSSSTTGYRTKNVKNRILQDYFQ